MTKLWVVGGGIESIPGLEKCAEMGIECIVSDWSEDAPGVQFAEDRGWQYVPASIYDVDTHLYWAVDLSYDGVISFGVDAPRTVWELQKLKGLPGHGDEVVRVCSDKLSQRCALFAGGLKQPWFIGVTSEVSLVANFTRPVMVLKPIDSRGARGVLRLTKDVDLGWAFRHSNRYTRRGGLLLEEYMNGPQISTECLVVNGRCKTLGFIDRNYTDHYWPYLIENGGQQPSVLSDDEKLSVISEFEKAVAAIGIVNGTAKGDMVLTEWGPRVVEIACRLSGGYMSSHQIELATGVDFLRHAIEIELGERPDVGLIRPTTSRGVAIRYVTNGREKSHPERGDHFICVGRTREDAVMMAGERVKSHVLNSQ